MKFKLKTNSTPFSSRSKKVLMSFASSPRLGVFVVGRRAGVVAAGAVDEDVARAEVGEDRFAARFEGSLVEDVRLVAFGNIALLRDRFGGLLRAFEAQIEQRDFRSARGVGFREARADDSAGAGHDDDFVLEVNFKR